MSKAKKTVEQISTIKYRMIFEGMVVGLITGILVSLFRLAIEEGEKFRTVIIAEAFGANHDPKFFMIFAAMILVSGIIVFIGLLWEPLSSGSGIPQIKGELLGQEDQKWGRIIVTKILGAVAGISAGLSLGREGPSIQVGAMVGKGFSKVRGKLLVEEKMLITCGAGAGLAGAFCAPLAGVVFSLEELHKNFSTEVLLSTMSASIASNFVAAYIFGLDPVFDLNVKGKLPLESYWIILILGLGLGLLGKVYNNMMIKALDLYGTLAEKVHTKALGIAIAFSFVIILALILPQALGSGHHLVGEIANGHNPFDGMNWGLGSKIGEFPQGAALCLLILLIGKLIFSGVSFGSGVSGGIFLPLLVLGAIFGGLLGGELGQFAGYGDLYSANFVVLGMTGLFASVVRAPITGVILITEMTGDFSNFLPLAVVALIAYVVADFTGASPIYDKLLERMMKGLDAESPYSQRIGRKVLIESEVYFGAPMDGSKIEDMLLPAGCLVISVVREGKEIIPSGATVLAGGDKLVILCAEAYLSQVNLKLNKICKTIGG